MSGRTERVIGTTEESITAAEQELNRRFPPSYRNWCLQNNGRGIEVVNLFPIFDPRDPRKTWDSIVRNYHGDGQDWRENVAEWGFDSSPFLPIGKYCDGDYCCLDYSQVAEDGEVPVVLWSHETGDTEPGATTFGEFLIKLENGEFDND
ncbi:MAG TPA: SMI1/KNR4 family protein [Pyrinomonadaceae bacterium]|nr:SMI1/KNR4 family protein [Pyrinomonadaceae bacterium]